VDDGRISLMSFTVTGMPAGATVTGARLTLRGVQSQNTQTVDVYAVGNAWSEATNWNTRPALGTKIGSGQLGNGVSMTVPVPVTGNGIVSFAVTRATVGSDNVAAASEHTNAAYRPKLTVNWSTPDPVATPAPPPTALAPAAFQPYSPGSFFSSRVDGPSVPIDATRTDQFRRFMATYPDQSAITWPKLNMSPGWAMSYDYGTADDPVWRLVGGNTSLPKLQILTTQGLHMGDSVAATFPPGTADRPGVIIDTVFGYTVQLADAVPDLATHTITVSNAGIMWHGSNGLDYRDPASDDQRNFVSRGRIPDAMIVTREELDHAVAAGTGVGHVLHLYLAETNTADGFAHPMVGAESADYGWGAEGERIRIKPSVDLVARGLTGHALALARTLQENGSYIGDNSGSSTQLKLSQAARYTGTNLSTDVFRGRLFWTDFEVVSRGWQ
jgi:hypothetical protein